MEKILAKMEKVRMEKFLAKMEKIIVSLRFVVGKPTASSLKIM